MSALPVRQYFQKVTHMMQRYKVWLVLIGGIVAGLCLGLFIGWWWLPVEWNDARPVDLRSDFRDDYFLWIAEQYALSNDLDWARGMLLTDSDANKRIVEELKALALEQEEEAAIRVMVLALALESITQDSFLEATAEVCPSCSPFVLVSVPILLVVGVAGGGILVLKGFSKPGQAHTIIEKAPAEPLYEVSGIGVSSMGIKYEQRSRLVGLYRFLSSGQNSIALLILCLFLIMAIAAPWLAPQADPENPSYFRIAEVNGRSASTVFVPLPPGPGIPLGTVPGGFDVYYSLVWGVRPALRFGLTVALAAAFIGIVVGAISGYLGGRFNSLTMRVTDAFLAFPAIAGVFLFFQVMPVPEPGAIPTLSQRIMTSLKLEPLVLALILFSWMPYARIVNSNVMKLKKSEYAMAAVTLGVGHSRIVFRHLLPNGIAPGIVLVARDIGSMVVLEAAFTFIGLSSGLPWGVILVKGRDWIIGPGGNPMTYWWIFLPVTLALIFFGIGWNLLGDGLNDVMDPRSLRHKVN